MTSRLFSLEIVGKIEKLSSKSVPFHSVDLTDKVSIQEESFHLCQEAEISITCPTLAGVPPVYQQSEQNCLRHPLCRSQISGKILQGTTTLLPQQCLR